MHEALDASVIRAYAWNDLDAKHDFIKTSDGIRWSIREDILDEILCRLLEMSHDQHVAELETAALKAGRSNGNSKASKKRVELTASDEQMSLTNPQC